MNSLESQLTLNPISLGISHLLPAVSGQSVALDPRTLGEPSLMGQALGLCCSRSLLGRSTPGQAPLEPRMPPLPVP